MVRVENGFTIITFKSDLSFFIKERAGIKRNTVRLIDNDSRFDILEKFEDAVVYNLMIEIVCSEDFSEFRPFKRIVSDISYFDGYVIISWC